MKRTNPACILLSNYSPEEAYPNLMLKSRVTIEALLSRLQVIQVTPEDPLDLNYLRGQLAIPLFVTTPATVTVANQENDSQQRPAATEDRSSTNSDSSLQESWTSNPSGLQPARNSTPSISRFEQRDDEEESVHPRTFLFEPQTEKRGKRRRNSKEALDSDEEEEEIQKQRRKRKEFQRRLKQKRPQWRE